MNENGEKVGVLLKASLFDHSVGYKLLAKRMIRNKEVFKKKDLIGPSEKKVFEFMKGSHTLEDFKQHLKQCNMDVLFRTNDTGRIYGVTFTDHTENVVFNGSRLGKMFSANAINDMFNK